MVPKHALHLANPGVQVPVLCVEEGMPGAWEARLLKLLQECIAPGPCGAIHYPGSERHAVCEPTLV